MIPVKKFRNFGTIGLIIVGLVLWTTALQAQKLHFIFFTATHDAHIDSSVQASEKMLETRIKSIAHMIGMDLKMYQFSGSKFTKPNLERTIRQIRCGSDDVILFYCIGHGFRYQDTQSDFPILYLTPNMETEYRHLNKVAVGLEDVHDWLRGKNARLTLTISEVCNADVEEDAPINELAFPMDTKTIKHAYNRLFKSARGSYIVASSKAYQKSWGHDEQGGFFTNAFLNALDHTIENGYLASWTTIWRKTVRYTQIIAKQFSKIQVPVYRRD